MLTLQLNEEYFVFLFDTEENRTTDEMFKNSDSEGVFEIFINRYLKNNEVKFRKKFSDLIMNSLYFVKCPCHLVKIQFLT